MCAEALMTESCEHVLFLTLMRSDHRPRVLRQIGKFAKSELQMTLVTFVEEVIFEREFKISTASGIWSRVLNLKEDQPLEYFGDSNHLRRSLFQYVHFLVRASEDNAYLTKAISFQRILLFIHCSARVRIERRKIHQDYRVRMESNFAKDEKARTDQRFSTASWYEIRLRGNTDSSNEFIQRISEAGEPMTIQLCEAFALNSRILLAMRWRAKQVYYAFEKRQILFRQYAIPINRSSISSRFGRSLNSDC